MFITRHIPNALTCSNLLCGCIGIAGLYLGWEVPFAYFVWAACVFDFLDGFAARALKVTSPIGKELDSLADMVTFGVLPSLVMFRMLTAFTPSFYLAAIAFLLAICSALRLAKFNVDERQRDGFIGLNTPSNALFITAIPFVYQQFPEIPIGLYGLLAITILFSWLMVSPLPMFSLKFKGFKWKGNEQRFTLIALSVLWIALLREASLVAIIITYLLMSLWVSWRQEGSGEKLH